MKQLVVSTLELAMWNGNASPPLYVHARPCRFHVVGGVFMFESTGFGTRVSQEDPL